MNSITKLVLTLLTGSLLFSACSSKSDVGKAIPKDAALVIHINGKSMTSKLSWDEIKQTGWYKEISADTTITGMHKELMQDPTITGIDIKNDMVMFMVPDPAGQGQLVGQADIADTKKFEEFYKKSFPGIATTTQDGITFLPMKDDALMAWKDKHLMILTNFNNPGFGGLGDMRMDTTLALPPAGNSLKLIESSKKIFALKSDNSLADNDRFNSLMKEDGDIHVYYNVEAMMKASMGAAPGVAGMLNLDKFIAGTVSTYTANFEDGKITVKSKFYPSKDLADIFKKYDEKKIDEDMVKNIPSQNVAGIMAMTFPPEGLRDLVKLTGMDGMLNMVMAQAGITLDDFIKANKGDLLIAITDLSLNKDSAYRPGTDTTEYKTSSPVDFLFAVGIGDKTSFDKLVNAGKKMSGESATKDIKYNGNDKYFAISNKDEVVKKFLAGGGSAPAYWDKLKGHGFGMYVDLQYIFKSIMSTGKMNDSSTVAMISESQKTFENVFSVGDGFSDGAMKGTFTLNFMDKGTNSLKTLNKYFDHVAVQMMEKKKKDEQGWNSTDTTTVVLDTIVKP